MGFIKINVLKSKYGGSINDNEDLGWALSNNRTEQVIINTNYVTLITSPEMCSDFYHPEKEYGKYFYVYMNDGRGGRFVCKESEYEDLYNYLSLYA